MTRAERDRSGYRIFSWTVIWLLVMFFAAEHLIRMGWVWSYPGIEPYILRSKTDDWVHNAFKIHGVKNNTAGHDRRFIFIGGSAGLCSITSDASMTSRLEALTGQRTKFTSICSSYKTFSDEAKIVEETGRFNGTLLISMEALRFKASPDEQLVKSTASSHTLWKYFFLTASEKINQILSEYDLKPGLRDNFVFFATMKVLGEVLKKKTLFFMDNKGAFQYLTYDRSIYVDYPPVGADFEAELKTKSLPRMLERCTRHFEMNLDLLSDVIETALLNGNRVILVDQPYNPLFTLDMARYNEKYNVVISHLIKEKKIGYIDMRNAVEWLPEDFRDAHHLRGEGPEKFTDAFALQLAAHPFKGATK